MVSIIMPVHNSGKLLNESIASIIYQTYKNFELICIDDASDDILTKRLLEYYAKKDKRIKLLTKKHNIGAAKARNIGLKYALGEYVVFLDADDMFDNIMIEKLYECIIDNEADMCICGYREYLDDQNKIGRSILPVQKKGITDRVFQLKELPDDGLVCWAFAPWVKMYRSNFLLKEEIYFQSLSSSNDVYFSCMSSICAKKIVYCQGGVPLLNYRTNNKKQISSNPKFDNFYKAIEFLLDKRKKHINIEEYRKIIYALMSGSIYILDLQGNELEKKNYYDLVKGFLKSKAADLVFDNIEGNKILGYFIENKYESHWFELRGDYYGQLKNLKKELFVELQGRDRILIWGNGKRGNALQKLFKECGMNLVKITDQKNENIGEKTIYGYEIICTEAINNWVEIIIATNKFVYNYVLNKYNIDSTMLIELEKYCPYD